MDADRITPHPRADGEGRRAGPSPVLYGCVVLVILVLLGLVVLMAPLGLREADREWFFYKNRNNLPCRVSTDCIPYALKKCSPPGYVVECRRKDEDYLRKGVCICGIEGLNVGLELEYRDAGADASR